jgi:adenylate kinase
MERFAVVLIGPPGSGKTLITEHLEENKEVATLKMGRLLRDEIKQGTALGDQLKPTLDSGHLAPIALVAQVVEQALGQIEARIILFDGFPRRTDQLEPFLQLSQRFELHLAAVIVLELSPDIAMKRLTGRRVCPNCGATYNIYFDPPSQPGICDRCGAALEQRPDDKSEVIQERLETYRIETVPIIDYFKLHFPDKTYFVSVEKPIPEVLSQVSATLKQVGLNLTAQKLSK